MYAGEAMTACISSMNESTFPLSSMSSIRDTTGCTLSRLRGCPATMPVRRAAHTSCGDSILASSVLSLKKRLWHCSRMPGRSCIALHSCCASSIVKPQMLSYFLSREMSVSHSSDPPTGDSAIGVPPTAIIN